MDKNKSRSFLLPHPVQ